MRKPVSLETRRELSAAVAERYRAADRLGKKAILDEFVKVTGYHRKHAIRIMNGKQVAWQQKPVGERIHQAAVDEALSSCGRPATEFAASDSKRCCRP